MEGKIYIFGAGRYGKELLRYLQNRGVEVLAFIDNDPMKQGENINGVECISLEEAIERGAQKEIICISAIQSTEIELQLKQRCFSKVINAATWLSTWMKKQKFLTPPSMEASDYCMVHPFNYYDSAYPNVEDIRRDEKNLFNMDKKVYEIDFNIGRQLEVMHEIDKISPPEWPIEENYYVGRYYSNNRMFRKESADELYYMMNIIKPKNIIEVGSGFSTAVMLDTNEKYFDNSINIISIEPYTDRVKALLRPTDHLQLYEKKLQKVPVNFFEVLGENDILFIDSSHVSRIDSDVNYLFFDIFPRLKTGVYIFFHDIFYPFIYPKHWIYQGRAYNEIYVLRAFLMNNNKYSIQFFAEMLEHCYKEELSARLVNNCSGSIWLRKDHF